MLARLAASAFDWWREAGVDATIDEAPRNWLVSERAAPSTSETPATPMPTAPIRYPADLAAFRAWLLADAAVPGHAGQRFDTVGDPASDTIIVIDMPEPTNRSVGQLLAGEVGELFDRMLTAIEVARARAYLIPFAPARPTSGRLDQSMIAALTPVLRHHLRLLKPRRLLLMGDAPVRALLGIGIAEARGRAHELDLDGVTLQTVASFHPRFILQASSPADRTNRRRTIWADLQLYQGL